MTVKELYDRLGVIVKGGGHDNHRVVVRTSGGGIGATPSTDVRSCGIGFDWDHGKCILYTVDPVFTKPKQPKSA